jgi:HTH-type transcriptional regulator, glycine betaine synthesis regulator
MTTTEYDRIVRRLVEAAGHASQSLGIGRVMGQIFAYLYLSREPRSLDDLTSALGISKGSASMGVRQLEQWGALEKVWVKGDRKDYYRARDSFGKIIKSIIRDLAGKRIESSAILLNEVEELLNKKGQKGDKASGEDEFIKERIEKIKLFQNKAQGMWDGVILKMLLK